MGQTQGMIGLGTTLSYAPITVTAGVATPGTYVLLSEVVDASAPEEKVGKAELTNYTSPAGKEEWLPAWSSPGEAKLKLNFLASDAATVYGILRQVKSWKLTLPDTSTIVWTGWISAYGVAVPIKERVTQECSLQMTGGLTITAATGS